MSIFDQNLGGGDSHAWEVSEAEAIVLNQGCSGLKFHVKATITSRLRKVHVFLPLLFSLSSSPSANGTRSVEMLEKKKKKKKGYSHGISDPSRSRKYQGISWEDLFSMIFS